MSWINVMDKLPTNFGKVFIFMPFDSSAMCRGCPENKRWNVVMGAVYSPEGFGDPYGYPWNHLVTHWAHFADQAPHVTKSMESFRPKIKSLGEFQHD